MADENLATQIADRLRRDILRGNLRPDARVKERDNAPALGVSRTPMREAIRILATEGLVVLRPSRSPRGGQSVVSGGGGSGAGAQVAGSAFGRTGLRAGHRGGPGRDPRPQPADERRSMTAAIRSISSRSTWPFTPPSPAPRTARTLAETHRAYLARLWRGRYLAARQRQNRDRARAHHDAILAALEARDPRCRPRRDRAASRPSRRRHPPDHRKRTGQRPEGDRRLKITAIRTFRTEEFANVLWVHVETDAGLTGLGETFYGAEAGRGAYPQHAGRRGCWARIRWPSSICTRRC